MGHSGKKSTVRYRQYTLEVRQCCSIFGKYQYILHLLNSVVIENLKRNFRGFFVFVFGDILIDCDAYHIQHFTYFY